MTRPSLVIGTRGSDLALWQARWVADRLGGESAGIRIDVVRTQGDRDAASDLADAGGLGLFTRDIEQALLEGRIDLAVHSLKDLPTTLPPGLVIAAVPARADAGDVLLARADAIATNPFLPLRRGARVGTGSPRRRALLSWLRPDLEAAPMRGNVPTRVGKCIRGDVDAVVLARAGVARLGLDVSPLVAFDLDPAHWIPAPAQGALGLEAREGATAILARVVSIADDATARAVATERALLALLEAGCHAALGAWCRRAMDGFVLSSGALGDDGLWHAVDVAGPDAAPLVDIAAVALESAPVAEPARGAFAPAAPWR